jgi:hypothetical protein
MQDHQRDRERAQGIQSMDAGCMTHVGNHETKTKVGADDATRLAQAPRFPDKMADRYFLGTPIA